MLAGAENGATMSLADDIKQLLECSICRERYNDPRMLPCQHCFCNHCIDSLEVQSNKCPICRKRFTRPGVRSCLMLNNLLEIASKHSCLDVPRVPTPPMPHRSSENNDPGRHNYLASDYVDPYGDYDDFNDDYTDDDDYSLPENVLGDLQYGDEGFFSLLLRRNHPEIFLEGFGFLDQGLLQHGAGNGAGIGTNGRPRSMRRIRIINNNGRNRNAAQAGNNNGGATGENVPSTPNQSNISSGGRGGFGRSRAGGSSATPAWAATNSAAMSRHVPHSEVVEDKIFRRCPEWPRCCLGNNCSFQHPTRPCRNGRNCPYGDNCCFLHDGEVAVP